MAVATLTGSLPWLVNFVGNVRSLADLHTEVEMKKLAANARDAHSSVYTPLRADETCEENP